MVALLVLATFVAFISVDVLLHRDKYRFRVAEPVEPERTAPAIPVVAGVALPDNLSYHPGHTWALDQGNGRMRIGVDEFAASLVGSIQRLDLPQRGRWLRQGEKGWTMSTPHGDASLLAPVEGEIVAVNEQAAENPQQIAQDPYGEGWLLEVFTPDAPVTLRNLLSGSLARRWMEESVSQLRHLFSPALAQTALDGGRLASNLGQELPKEKWERATRQFFRS